MKRAPVPAHAACVHAYPPHRLRLDFQFSEGGKGRNRLFSLGLSPSLSPPSFRMRNPTFFSLRKRPRRRLPARGILWRFVSDSFSPPHTHTPLRLFPTLDSTLTCTTLTPSRPSSTSGPRAINFFPALRCGAKDEVRFVQTAVDRRRRRNRRSSSSTKVGLEEEAV